MRDENGATKYIKMSFCVTPTMKKKIQQAAAIEKKTMTAFITDAVSTHIDEMTETSVNAEQELAYAYNTVLQKGNGGHICRTCAWCEWETRHGAPYCTNLRSKYCSQWIDDRLGCDAWEKATYQSRHKAR